MNRLSRIQAGADPDFLRVPQWVRYHTLGFLAGRLTQDPPNDCTHSGLLLSWLLKCWRLLPSLALTDVDGSLRQLLAPADHQRLRYAWLAVNAFARAQVGAGRTLIRELENQRIEYSLLKGAATAFSVYTSPHHRTSWDFDVGVATDQLRHAEDIAWSIGFRPAEKNEDRGRFERADPVLRAIVEAQHYELGFLVRRLCVHGLSEEELDAIRSDEWARQFWLDTNSETPWCYAIVDIHHAISHDIGLENLLSNTRRIAFGELSVRVPSAAWLAAHLIYKIYWEGVHTYGKGLYQYGDLVRVIPELDESSFAVLLGILERHNMRSAGHYVLRRLPQFGIGLPPHISDFVDATYTPKEQDDPIRLNDLGDMWPRLWGQR